jgi:hypothetical protein
MEGVYVACPAICVIEEIYGLFIQETTLILCEIYEKHQFLLKILAFRSFGIPFS